jgi:hypothetical protein
MTAPPRPAPHPFQISDHHFHAPRISRTQIELAHVTALDSGMREQAEARRSTADSQAARTNEDGLTESLCMAKSVSPGLKNSIDRK